MRFRWLRKVPGKKKEKRGEENGGFEKIILNLQKKIF
jgi:hypothetical protein